MKILRQYLPMIYPARKFFELLYLEHMENRKDHNSYNKDVKKEKKYSAAKAGINRKGVHSAEWIMDIISSSFIDPSFIAFLKPLINDKGYDRKPVLPYEIDLEYTTIPNETYQICNIQTVRAFVDVMILGNYEDEDITRILKEFNRGIIIDPISITKYKYFFFNVPFHLTLRKNIYEIMQDIAGVDPEFERSYQSQLSLLGGVENVDDILNNLGYEDGTNSYERGTLKKIIDRTAQEIIKLMRGDKSDVFNSIGDGFSALKQSTGTYIAMKGVLKSEPVITDTIVKAPLQSSEIFELSPGEQKAIFYGKKEGRLNSIEIANMRDLEKKELELKRAGSESVKSKEDESKDSPKSIDPKEDDSKGKPDAPIAVGYRKG